MLQVVPTRPSIMQDRGADWAIRLLVLLAISGLASCSRQVVRPSAEEHVDLSDTVGIVGPVPIVTPESMARYPEDARRHGVEGVVQLEALINSKGEIERVEYMNAADKELAEAARDAMVRSKWLPAIQGGKPIGVWIARRFNFVLHESVDNCDDRSIELRGAGYIRVEDSKDLQLTDGSFTLETWLIAYPNDYYQTIFDKRTYPVTGGYWFGIDRTNVLRLSLGTYQLDLVGNRPIERDKLYHVAAVVDRTAGQALLYIDSDLDARMELPPDVVIATCDAPLYLGASKTDSSMKPENFWGVLDEAVIWREARSLNQIKQSMLNGVRGVEPNVVACWHFNENSGTMSNDTSGAHHTANAIGSVRRICSPVAHGILSTQH